MPKDEFAIEKLGAPRLNSPVRNIAFVPDDATVTYEVNAEKIAECIRQGGRIPAFERAGARAKIFHDPAWSRAAILTAGGLCPGLNEVIKFLTLTLIEHYKIPMVYGIRYGYRGLDPANGLSPLLLNEDNVDDIHEVGGSILGSSRGEVAPDVMVDTLVRMNINLLFCIGGDGTARGAHAITEVIRERKLAISVIVIPKTIDNDLNCIDQSFGFATAVLHAGRAVTGAHNEAHSAFNGVGLVKVMGRDSGFIAAYATLANPFVNYCLIPEEPFSLEGDDPRALLPHLADRLSKRRHAVVMVAEGAGQEFFKDREPRRDASGNILKDDIGVLLKEEIIRYFRERKTEINVKYFDLGYSIRSVAAEGEDAVFCGMLAQDAVHAAMSGRTDMMVGHWAGCFTHVPIPQATRARKKIELNSPLWSSVKSITVF